MSASSAKTKAKQTPREYERTLQIVEHGLSVTVAVCDPQMTDEQARKHVTIAPRETLDPMLFRGARVLISAEAANDLDIIDYKFHEPSPHARHLRRVGREPARG